MKKDIAKLLDKYFEGETSIQEERDLQKYFSSKEVAPEYLKYAPMFKFFEEEKREISLPQKGRKKKNLIWMPMVACAACIAFVILVTNLRQDGSNESLVYVDGQLISDSHSINGYVLESLTDIQDVDQNVFDSQIEVLDFFTEE